MRNLSWLAIAATIILSGCSGTRIDPYRPHGGGNGGGNGGSGGGNGNQQPQVQITERNDWSVQYRGRTTYDGTTQEEFQFNYTGDAYFILRTVTEADFAEHYKGDLKTFIDEEVAATLQTAKNQNVSFTELNEVFNKTIKTFYSGILIHNVYTAYLIEIGSNGKATYNYCKAEANVEEEVATAEYSAWLGVWTVSDGYVGYDIEVSHVENNYLYRVDGWETGHAAGTTQMNQDDDWIETRLMDDGTLSFFIQFIAQYENYENLGTVDYMFVGTYVESSGEKVDDWEGWEVGWAEDNGASVVLNAGNTEFEVNGKVYKPAFNSMRYSLYCHKDELWYHFHDAVPEFPMTMVKTKASTGIDRTPVHTRNYVRRTQPKAAVNGSLVRKSASVEKRLRNN